MNHCKETLQRKGLTLKRKSERKEEERIKIKGNKEPESVIRTGPVREKIKIIKDVSFFPPNHFRDIIFLQSFILKVYKGNYVTFKQVVIYCWYILKTLAKVLVRCTGFHTNRLYSTRYALY